MAHLCPASLQDRLRQRRTPSQGRPLVSALDDDSGFLSWRRGELTVKSGQTPLSTGKSSRPLPPLPPSHISPCPTGQRTQRPRPPPPPYRAPHTPTDPVCPPGAQSLTLSTAADMKRNKSYIMAVSEAMDATDAMGTTDVMDTTDVIDTTATVTRHGRKDVRVRLTDRFHEYVPARRKRRSAPVSSRVAAKVSASVQDKVHESEPSPALVPVSHVAGTQKRAPVPTPEPSSSQTSCLVPMVALRSYVAPPGGVELTVNKGEVVAAQGHCQCQCSSTEDVILVRNFKNQLGYVPARVLKTLAVDSRSQRDFSQQFPADEGYNSSCSPPLCSLDMLPSSTSPPSENMHDQSSNTCQSTSPLSDICQTFGSLGINKSRRRSAMYVASDSGISLASSSRAGSVTSSMGNLASPGRHSVSSANQSGGELGTELTVFADYVAIGENDVTVCAQDVVTLIDAEDKRWIYVQTKEGGKGFIPRTHAVDLSVLNLDPNTKTTYL